MSPSAAAPIPEPRPNPSPGALEGRIVVVLGTRPEAVKLAPVIRALGADAHIVHTGQHYDPAMSEQFSAAIGLREPDVRLQVGGAARTEQIRRATCALFGHIDGSGARAVVVQGDTNSALAGALAAHRSGVPIVHVEAGLRSHDRAMPEEHNRIVIDHLSTLACAPTEVAAAALRRELAGGAATTEVIVTGNTVVDALLDRPPTERDIATLLARHGLERDSFVLATLHRPENVDDRERLQSIVDVLADAPVDVVFPAHPRVASRLPTGPTCRSLRAVEPLPHHEFLALLASCAVCVSDSGGIQEEVSVLGRPVIVVRRSTERPEVLGTFATLTPSVGELRSQLQRHLAERAEIHARLRTIETPYGDGHAGARIASEIMRRQ